LQERDRLRGIRNDITSRQGLERFSTLGVESACRRHGLAGLIFHPKIYALDRKKRASHHWQREHDCRWPPQQYRRRVSVDLDFKDASDKALYDSIENEFAGLHAKYQNMSSR